MNSLKKIKLSNSGVKGFVGLNGFEFFLFKKSDKIWLMCMTMGIILIPKIWHYFEMESFNG
jgi:hypothetical protein